MHACMLHSTATFWRTWHLQSKGRRCRAGGVMALQRACGFQVRQRAIANVRFIGHLYRKGLLSGKLVHGCVSKLLAGCEAPKAGNVECLICLMSTAGQQLEANPKAKKLMDTYFHSITILRTNMSLERRLRFMLQASMHPFCSTVINMLCLSRYEEIPPLITRQPSCSTCTWGVRAMLPHH